MAVSSSGELAILIDVLVKRGISTSEINSGINQKIKTTFKQLSSESSDNVQVFRDGENGAVKIFVDGVDKTPADFQEKSQAAAKEYLLEKIQNSEDKKLATPEIPHSSPRLLKWLGVFFFYFYNGLYLIFLVFWGYLLTNPATRTSLFEGVKELGNLRSLSILVLLLIPLFCFYKLLRNHWYKDSTKVFKLFVLFEVPVVFLLFLISFAFGNATKITWLLSLSILILPLIGINKIDPSANPPIWKKRLDIALLFSSTILITYITMLYAFFFPPMLFFILKQSFQAVQNAFSYGSFDAGFLLGNILSLGIGSIGVLIAIAALFIPFLLAGVCWRVLRNFYRDLVSLAGLIKTNYLLGTVFLITVLTAAVVSYQPDPSPLIDKLAQFNSSSDFETQESVAKELVRQKDTIRQTLKDMSTSSSRYLMSKNDTMLEELYKNSFGTPESVNYSIQQVFSIIGYPFIYQGPKLNDNNITNNYQTIFGEYYYSDNYKQPKNVNLLSRSITAQTSDGGAIATISIEEEYEQSKTNNWRDEEVLYEFALPEGAAVTDLKLGPNLEFQGVVAPRGAAQLTYQQEVNKFRDPAILEQTGPRQYRLRVFPVPRKDDKTTLGGKNQKVRFTYTTLLSANGFGLPRYSREQNINVNQAPITLSVDSQTQNISHDSQFIATKNPICSLTSTIIVPSAYASASASLIPANSSDFQANKVRCEPNLLTQAINQKTGLRVAIIYDTSINNKDNDSLEEIKEWISTYGSFLTNNQVDFYKFNSTLSKPIKLTTESNPEVVYFGVSDLTKIKEVIYSSQDYNQIIIITGSSDKEVFGAQARLEKEISGYPHIHFVFKDGKIPAFNQDLSLQAIHSRAQLSDSFTESMNSLFGPEKFIRKDDLEHYSFINDYWAAVIPNSTIPSTYPSKTELNKSTLPLVIAQSVRDRIYSSFNSGLLPINDFHAPAETAGVVTPYSSYIALVNETQKQTLQNFSQSADKFVDSYIGPAGGGMTFGGGGLGISPQRSSLMLPSLGGSPMSLRDSSVGFSTAGSLSSNSAGILDIFSFGTIFIIGNVLLLVAGLAAFLIIKFVRNRTNKP